jgi:hypothetical protein
VILNLRLAGRILLALVRGDPPVHFFFPRRRKASLAWGCAQGSNCPFSCGSRSPLARLSPLLRPACPHRKRAVANAIVKSMWGYRRNT